MEALVLRVKERLSYKRIGERLGVSERRADQLTTQALTALNRPINHDIRDARKNALRARLEEANERLFAAGVLAEDAEMCREWRGTVDQLARLDGLNEPTRVEAKIDVSKWASLPPDDARARILEFVREHIAVIGPMVDEVRDGRIQ